MKKFNQWKDSPPSQEEVDYVRESHRYTQENPAKGMVEPRKEGDNFEGIETDKEIERFMYGKGKFYVCKGCGVRMFDNNQRINSTLTSHYFFEPR